MAGIGTLTHGHARRGKFTPTYLSWVGMISRCERPAATQFKWYGGRGIRVCRRWRHSFEAFLSDMGERPPGHTLDRKRESGHYTPRNCRWATPREQARNSRWNLRLTFRGSTRCAVEWAEIVGLNPKTIYRRVSSGWSVARALTTPVRSNANGAATR